MDKKEILTNALSRITHPKWNIPLNHADVLANISINDRDVTVWFYDPPGSTIIQQLTPVIESVLFEENWVTSVSINAQLPTPSSIDRPNGLANVTHVIAVSSCKGGVGKSTIALNLASALRLNGAEVGIFDADIHGPSLPTLIKPTSMATTLDPESLPPFLCQNMRLMSYGYVQDQVNQPAILRGPMASNVLKQLLFKTDWGHLDYLIIDCPPGTGDVLITISQEVKLSGAIIVTTPHELAYADVVKGIEMFKKVKVPVLSLIENMSYFTCHQCDERHHIFGQGRLQACARTHHIDQWYQLPIQTDLSNKYTDMPYLFTLDDDHPMRHQFEAIANDTVWSLTQQSTGSPIQVEYDNDAQSIIISADNQDTIQVPYEPLRGRCECAYCVDEMTRTPQWQSSDYDPTIRIESLQAVGHYAFAIVWTEHNRRHNSLYTHHQLLTLNHPASL